MKKFVCTTLFVLGIMCIVFIYIKTDPKLKAADRDPYFGLTAEKMWKKITPEEIAPMLGVLDKKINGIGKSMGLSKVYTVRYVIKDSDDHLRDFETNRTELIFYPDKDGCTVNFRGDRKTWKILSSKEDKIATLVDPHGLQTTNIRGEKEGSELEESQEYELKSRFKEMTEELTRWKLSDEEFTEIQPLLRGVSRQDVQVLKSRVGTLMVMYQLYQWRKPENPLQTAFAQVFAEKLSSPQDEWIKEYFDYFRFHKTNLFWYIKGPIIVGPTIMTILLFCVMMLCIYHFWGLSVWDEIKNYAAEKQISRFRGWLWMWREHWLSFLFYPPDTSQALGELFKKTLPPLVKKERIWRTERQARHFWKEHEPKIQKSDIKSTLNGLYNKAMDSASTIEIREDALDSLMRGCLSAERSRTPLPFVEPLPKPTKKGGGGGSSRKIQKHQQRSVINLDFGVQSAAANNAEDEADDSDLFGPEERIFFLGAGYTITGNVQERIRSIVKIQGGNPENCWFFDATKSGDMQSVTSGTFHWCIVLTKVMGHSMSDTVKNTALSRGENSERVIEIHHTNAKKLRDILARKIRLARKNLEKQKGGKKSNGANGH